jgi:PhnB protein
MIHWTTRTSKKNLNTPPPMISVPERYAFSVIPHLMVKDASTAISFYCQAFGAVELFRIPSSSGHVMHAEISLQGSVFFLGDIDDHAASIPYEKHKSVRLNVYVASADALLERARNFGVKVLSEPADMFYGARQCMVQDPYGHVWVFLEKIWDVDIAEFLKRSARTASRPVSR